MSEPTVRLAGERLDGWVDRALKDIEARDEGLRAFAERLVSTPSANPPNDTRAVADLIRTELQVLGISDVRVVGPDPQNANVLAEAAGAGPGSTLILSGHLDTKPAGDLGQWDRGPWAGVRSDGHLHGLGAADMKGGIAAMVYAASAFRASGAPGAVRLVLTADEETGGDSGAAWLANEGLVAGDAAIVGEPSGVQADWDQIRIVSRGVCLVRFFVDGDQIHSSLSDQVPAVSATVTMARLMTRLDQERAGLLRYRPHTIGDSGPTFNVGLDVKGGEGPGFLAQRASFLCDIRMLPDMRRPQVEEDLQAFLDGAATADPALRAHFKIEFWRDGSEVPSTAPIVHAIQRASHRVLGRVPPLGVFPGGTDAPFFQAVGIDTVPGFGPGRLSLAHRPNEWIAEQGINEAARLYAITALELVSATA